MRRSLFALAALVFGLATLLAPATLAAPKTSTSRTTTAKSTINRAIMLQMRNTTSAASVAQAKRQARAKKVGVLHFIQARNPRWATTGFMTFPQAVVARHALQVQGLSAHIHNTASNGSFVHYGMLHWANKGATTDRKTANAAAAQLRTLGLQARVVTKVYRNGQ